MCKNLYLTNVAYVEEIKYRLRKIFEEDVHFGDLPKLSVEGVVVDNGKQAIVKNPTEMTVYEFTKSFPVALENYPNKTLYNILTALSDVPEYYLTALHCLAASYNELRYGIEQELMVQVDPTTLQKNHNKTVDLSMFGVDVQPVNAIELKKAGLHFAVKVVDDDFYLLIDNLGSIVSGNDGDPIHLFKDEVVGCSVA